MHHKEIPGGDVVLSFENYQEINTGADSREIELVFGWKQTD